MQTNLKNQNMVQTPLEKGITLIALIITIIVLLILAGVTISMLFGDNGIISRAKDATEETRGASVEEARDLWFAEKMMDELTGTNTARTLEEVLQDLKNQNLLTDDEIAEILGNKVRKVEIGTRSGLDAISFKYGIIGDYVAYIPTSGTWDWDTVDDGNTYKTYSGSTSNTGTLSTKDLNWRVLDINDGQIILISEYVDNSKVYLKGSDGYNNGVKILDDICNTLYSGDKGTARSIKFEDMQEKMVEDALIERYPSSAGAVFTGHATTVYPKIWHEEKDSKLDGVTTGGTLLPSQQKDWVLGTNLLSGSSWTLSSPHWIGGPMNLTGNMFRDSIYYELFDYEGRFVTQTSYWFSTRGLVTEYSKLEYGLLCRISTPYLFVNSFGAYDNDSIERGVGIRPVVVLNSGVTINTSDKTKDGTSPESAWELL